MIQFQHELGGIAILERQEASFGGSNEAQANHEHEEQL